MTSPLLTVLKKDSTSRHDVMDLSFPLGNYVNNGISKDTFLDIPFQLHLPDIDAFLAFIQKFDKGFLLFKSDLHHPYRQLPMDPHDYHYLGYFFEDLLFLDTAFPFDLRTAIMACQRTINAVTFLHRLHRLLMILVDVTPHKMLLLLTMLWNSFSIYWDSDQLVTKTVPHPP